MKPKHNRNVKKRIRTPEQRDDRRGLGFAAGIHAALILLMLAGLVSSPKTPNPVQVELWAEGTTRTAAEPETQPEPDVVEEPAPPEPEPEIEPEPEPEPEPQAPPPQPQEPPTPPAEPQAQPAPPPEPEVDPDIALEEARKKR